MLLEIRPTHTLRMPAWDGAGHGQGRSLRALAVVTRTVTLLPTDTRRKSARVERDDRTLLRRRNDEADREQIKGPIEC